MHIREIQEMTLNARSAVERLTERLEARRVEPHREIEIARKRSQEKLTLRISIATADFSIIVDRVYLRPELFTDLRNFSARIAEQNVSLDIPNIAQDINNMPVVPKLGGGIRMTQNDQFRLSQAIYGDGLVEFFFYFTAASGDNPLYSSWVLGLLSNALIATDALRSVAGVPGAEMALDIEIEGARRTPMYCGFPELRYLGVGNIETGTFETNPLRLPPYPVLGARSFSDLVGRVMNDLREAASLKAVEGLNVNFG